MADQPISFDIKKLEIKNLSCERQDQLLFENLNFHATSGQLVRIHGENGSGKSSLLKIITGLLKPHSGDVNWNNQNITLQQKSYSRALTFIGHKPAIKSELTVIENIQALIGLRRQTLDQQRLTQALEVLTLNRYKDIEAGYLSQGQQRRIALTRLWLENSNLWILDEPYTALDKEAIKLVNNAINQFLKNGNIVVLTSHQETDALEGQIANIWLGE